MAGKVNLEHPRGIWKCKCEQCRKYRHEYRIAEYRRLESDPEYRARRVEWRRKYVKANPNKVRKWQEQYKGLICQRRERNDPKYTAKLERERQWHFVNNKRPEVKLRAASKAKIRYHNDSEFRVKNIETVSKYKKKNRDKISEYEFVRQLKKRSPMISQTEVDFLIEHRRKRIKEFRAKRIQNQNGIFNSSTNQQQEKKWLQEARKLYRQAKRMLKNPEVSPSPEKE